MNRYLAAAAALIAGLLSISHANAQLAVAKVVANCGTVSPTPHAGNTYPLTMDVTGTLCTVGGGGGGGGTSSNFGTTFPGAGTAAGFEYLASAPTLSNGNMYPGLLDVNGNLKVNVIAGGGANNSVGTNNTTAPTSSTQIGILVGSNLQPVSAANPLPTSGGNVIQATASLQGTASSSTTTQKIALSGSTVIYVTSYSEQTDAAASAAATFQLVAGTGTNCAGSQVALTPAWNFAAGFGIVAGSIGPVLVAPAGDAVCVKTTTTNLVNYTISYAQF